MKRVLIIRVCAIGDFILNLPTLVALHELNPNAQFTLAGNKASLALAKEFIPVENVYSMDLSPWPQLFYEAVPNLEFDYAIVWMKDATVAANLRLSGIPDVHRADPFPIYGHAADHLLRTLKLERPELPDLWVPELEDVIVHPGSGSPKKIWPHFEELMKRIPNAVVLREGANSSPPQLRRGGAKRRGGVGQSINLFDQHHPSLGFASALPSSAEEGSFSGRVLENLSLTEVSQHLRRCRAYIGNDSGITHLAAYLGCPTIALFGPTDPRVWGPLGRRSRIIWKSKLEDITVDEILLGLHAAHARTRING